MELLHSSEKAVMDSSHKYKIGSPLQNVVLLRPDEDLKLKGKFCWFEPLL
ncbi:hypothetical protein L195_g037335, partial [Trifolium pratense]